MDCTTDRFQRRDERAQSSGFTLIELLIVIVVLGILAAVVVFALGSVTSKSAKGACAADAKTVETAVGAYEANGNGTSPTSTNLTSSATTGGPYLRSWPTNSAHYYISLGAITGSPSDQVQVSPGSATPTQSSWVPFDTESSTTGCNAVT